MDKNALKKYAVWARNELLKRVSQKAQQYGIEKESVLDDDLDSINGVVLSALEKTQRHELIIKIKSDGYEKVMEEVAYTWFNRFTALRFMEVNNYLPSHTRIFTNESNEFKPQILTDALSLDLDGLDLDIVYELKNGNKTEELYKYLLIIQCNALSLILPEIFSKIENYTSLLLPDFLLREGSVIEQMIKLIPENDWLDQVEVIGWLYQYYINEPKDLLINAKKQYKSSDVPYVTQIFTSDWIVQYMVQNSLGRYWIEKTKDDYTEYGWEYYMDSPIVETCKEYLELEKIKIVDPCMGSGHILAYAFDLLMQMYEHEGYTQREAAELILRNNIYGLDISERAYQLAYFSIMMKARKYSRNILNKKIKPNLYVMFDYKMNEEIIEFISLGNEKIARNLREINYYMDGISEYGSLIEINDCEFDQIKERILNISETYYDNIIEQLLKNEVIETVTKFINIAEMLNMKYDSVITNPPYIGNRLLPANMRKFIENNYVEYKSDIFSAFIARVISMCKKDGSIGMLTPYVWMFISTYEKLREKILTETTISSLVQLEYNAFEAACVPVCSFTLKKTIGSNNGEYVRLSAFRGADIQGPKVKEAVLNRNCGYRYTTAQNQFNLIPGSPIAYWVDSEVIECFSKGQRVDSFSYPKQGLATADNNRFLRLWFEVDSKKIGFNCSNSEEAEKSKCKWFPYNKGGGYKKWYGNNEYVINWENNGLELKNFKGSVIRSPQFYFREGISWCKITSSNFSMRYIPKGFLFDVAGCTLFDDNDKLKYMLGYMNSNINAYILALISPTLNFEVGHVGSLPIIEDKAAKQEIEEIVEKCISLCKADWDSYENSWDFVKNPLVVGKGDLANIYKIYSDKKENDAKELLELETKINEYFISIYGVDKAISSEVAEDDIIIGHANYKNDIIGLISYAVGCMFGRYSLDRDGLVNTGGPVNDEMYLSYNVDKDNIIPICDDEYFEDDIVARFVEFVRIAFGENDLESNLQFIADAFSYTGSSREVLRQYFINDFYRDHCNLYTSRGAGKRPIYWLFDSGKKNGFKALIYMHRYQPDTIARIRTDYVHEQQSRYRTSIADLEQRINNASTGERVKLSKQLKKVTEQAEEVRIYEEKIHHLADQMISIDLDDGVKVNYAKFQDVLAKIK